MNPQLPAFPATKVCELPARTLVGVSVRTSMQKATADCTALWERFAPWMWSVHGHCECRYTCPSFGISTDVDMQNGLFTYWAAIEIKPLFADPTTWPEGFGTFTLAGGSYVGTNLPELARLGEAYTYLYGPWLQQQDAYALNWTGNCFEYYDERYLKTGEVDVFVPVMGK